MTTFITTRQLAAELGYSKESVLLFVRDGTFVPDQTVLGGTHLFASSRLGELREALFTRKRARAAARRSAKAT